MRTIDIANEIINQSIEYSIQTKDKSYYTDFYSVNKLIYYAQAKRLKKYNGTIIDEPIIVDITGPFIKWTLPIFGKYNHDKITEKQEVELMAPSLIREIIRETIEEYGMLSTQEIGILSKNDPAWIEAYANSNNPEITSEMIKKSEGQREETPKSLILLKNK